MLSCASRPEPVVYKDAWAIEASCQAPIRSCSGSSRRHPAPSAPRCGGFPQTGPSCGELLSVDSRSRTIHREWRHRFVPSGL
jgi:hypothetical protein